MREMIKETLQFLKEMMKTKEFIFIMITFIILFAVLLVLGMVMVNTIGNYSQGLI